MSGTTQTSGGDGSSNSFDIKKRKTPALAINTESEGETSLVGSVLCSQIESSDKRRYDLALRKKQASVGNALEQRTGEPH